MLNSTPPKRPAKGKPAIPKNAAPAVTPLATPAPMPEPSAIASTGICLNCSWFITGQWYHPRCGNVQSPKFKHSMPDAGSCEEFTAKRSAPSPVAQPDGMYDPEPSADSLADLLDRETEPNVSGA